MAIRLVTQEQDLMALAPVLLQLRPQYSAESLVEKILQQMHSGFQVACLYRDNSPVCVAGFIIVEKLAWGKALYVDDLVTAEAHRSGGAGKQMLEWLKAFAVDAGCEQLHLDSGVQRTEAHRFYEREGMRRASIHFSIVGLQGGPERPAHFRRG